MNELQLDAQHLYKRYRDLQSYVHWTEEDAVRMRLAGPFVQPMFGELIDDFYQEISRHPHAHRVITGGGRTD